MIMEICEAEDFVGIRALYQNKDVKNAIHSIENEQFQEPSTISNI